MLIKRKTNLKRKPLKKKSSQLKRSGPLKSSPLQKAGGLSHGNSKLKKGKKQGKWHGMMDFFRSVWDSRCDSNGWCTDFEDGSPLHPGLREASITYHHLIYKSVNKDLAYEPRNIVLLTANNHQQAHNNLDSMPKVKAETQRIFNLYKNNEL